MINFDNAATTYPKPRSVRMAADTAIARYGGNPGRGGHPLAVNSARLIYSAREAAGRLFDAEPENCVLCMNCTHALNTAIKGVLCHGDHVIISSMEHNSVYRPVAALVKDGMVTCSIAEVSENDRETVHRVERLIQPSTRAIVFTAASNVTGQIMPIGAIGRLCREKGICFIVDGAQGCGVLPISMKEDCISILCTAGHKGLYGISGTGLLITDGSFPIAPLLHGGTGSASRSDSQPDFLPDRLESGTQNIVGAASMKAGIEFIEQTGREQIYRHEDRLCSLFINGIKAIPEVAVYRSDKARYAPIVSFNVEGSSPEDTAMALAKEGFCLRAGLHCAPLAHEHNGTPEGTVRFAPSVMNSDKEVTLLVNCIKKYVRNLKNEQKVLKSDSKM